MPQQIELTAEQLSALDQMISQKQKAEEFITDVVNVTRQVTPIVTPVAQAIGGAMLTQEKLSKTSVTDLLREIPVEKLVELRKNAIKKG